MSKNRNILFSPAVQLRDRQLREQHLNQSVSLRAQRN